MYFLSEAYNNRVLTIRRIAAGEGGNDRATAIPRWFWAKLLLLGPKHLVLEHLNLNLSVLAGGRDRTDRWLGSIQNSPVGLQIELGQTFQHLGILLALLPAELLEGLKGVWGEIGVEGTRPCWCHPTIASTLNPTEQDA